MKEYIAELASEEACHVTHVSFIGVCAAQMAILNIMCTALMALCLTTIASLLEL